MAQLNLRIDEEVKNTADKALKEMGLTLSSAINMFLVKVGREKRIPFEITAVYEPNEVTYKAIQQAEQGEEVYGPFDNMDDLMEALDA